MAYETSIKNATDIETLVATLSAVPVGGTIEYEALSKAIGASIQNRRFLALKAIDRLSTETGAIFVSVHRVGYKRLPPQESHIVGADARSRIRKSARRAGQKIIRAIRGANDLPRDAQMAANREIAMLGLIEHAASAKAMKAAVTKDTTPKPVAKVMADMLAQI